MDWGVLAQAFGQGLSGGVGTFLNMRELQRRMKSDDDDRNYRASLIAERKLDDTNRQIETARRGADDIRRRQSSGRAMRAFLAASPEGQKMLEKFTQQGSTDDDLGQINFNAIDEMMRALRPPVAKPETPVKWERTTDRTGQVWQLNPETGERRKIEGLMERVPSSGEGNSLGWENRQDRRIRGAFDVAKDERDAAEKKVQGFRDVLRDPAAYTGKGDKRHLANPADTAGYGAAQEALQGAEQGYGLARRAMFGDPAAIDRLLNPASGGAEVSGTATNQPSKGGGYMPTHTIGGEDVEKMDISRLEQLAERDMLTMRKAGFSEDRIALELSRKYRRLFSPKK